MYDLFEELNHIYRLSNNVNVETLEVEAPDTSVTPTKNPKKVYEKYRLNPRHPEFIGKRFNRFIVMGEVDQPGSTRWICHCDCGNEHVAPMDSIKGGGTKSCGCWHSEVSRRNGLKNVQALYDYCGTRKLRKGDSKEEKKLMRVWQAMNRRCSYPNYQGYDRYGGRGIKVCDEWKTENPDGFQNFYKWAMANGYRLEEDNTKKPTIDRIDNNGNYGPDNCRWVTYAEQGRNIRKNVYIDIDGKRYIMRDLMREYDTHSIAIYQMMLDGRIKYDWCNVDPAEKLKRFRETGEQYRMEKKNNA